MEVRCVGVNDTAYQVEELGTFHSLAILAFDCIS